VFVSHYFIRTKIRNGQYFFPDFSGKLHTTFNYKQIGGKKQLFWHKRQVSGKKRRAPKKSGRISLIIARKKVSGNPFRKSPDFKSQSSFYQSTALP